MLSISQVHLLYCSGRHWSLEYVVPACVDFGCVCVVPPSLILLILCVLSADFQDAVNPHRGGHPASSSASAAPAGRRRLFAGRGRRRGGVSLGNASLRLTNCRQGCDNSSSSSSSRRSSYCLHAVGGLPPARLHTDVPAVRPSSRCSSL